MIVAIYFVPRLCYILRMAPAQKNSTKRDISHIMMILATQCMINVGEVDDPVLKKRIYNPEGADLFYDLLVELEFKTRGNLTDGEQRLIDGLLGNLRRLIAEKSGAAHG
jgi:hypothetical protein